MHAPCPALASGRRAASDRWPRLWGCRSPAHRAGRPAGASRWARRRYRRDGAAV